MTTIRKQGRAIKRLIPGVPTSSHNPEHKAESKPEPKGNRRARRKAAAIARKGKS